MCQPCRYLKRTENDHEREAELTAPSLALRYVPSGSMRAAFCWSAYCTGIAVSAIIHGRPSHLADRPPYKVRANGLKDDN
jgi:hypothetical protein